MTDLDHLMSPKEQAAIVRKAVFLDMVQTNAVCTCPEHRYALDAAIIAAVKFGATRAEVNEARETGRGKNATNQNSQA